MAFADDIRELDQFAATNSGIELGKLMAHVANGLRSINSAVALLAATVEAQGTTLTHHGAAIPTLKRRASFDAAIGDLEDDVERALDSTDALAAARLRAAVDTERGARAAELGALAANVQTVAGQVGTVTAQVDRTIEVLQQQAEVSVVLQNLQNFSKLAGLSYTEAHKEITDVIAAAHESAQTAWKVSTFSLRTGLSFMLGAASVALADVADFGTRELLQVLFANSSPIGAGPVADWHSADIGGADSVGGKASQGAMDGSRDASKNLSGSILDAIKDKAMPGTVFLADKPPELPADDPLKWFQQSEAEFGRLATEVRLLEQGGLANLRAGVYDRAAMRQSVQTAVHAFLTKKGLPYDWKRLASPLNEEALKRQMSRLYKQFLWRHFARSRWPDNMTYAYKVSLKEPAKLRLLRNDSWIRSDKLRGPITEWPAAAWETSGWTIAKGLAVFIPALTTLGAAAYYANKQIKEPIGWSHILGSFMTVEEQALRAKKVAELTATEQSLLAREAWVSRAIVACCQVSLRSHTFARETWYDLELWNWKTRGEKAPYDFEAPGDYKHPPGVGIRDGSSEVGEYELINDPARMTDCEVAGGRSGRGKLRHNWT